MTIRRRSLRQPIHHWVLFASVASNAEPKIVAIVGSRNATRQGSENAQLFARALAQAGVTVVSGLALGIDAAAHRGALAASVDPMSDASTIAVVGTGVDVTYPASNRTLTTDIRKRGVVISEFTLRTPAIAHNFPRNSIIAGIRAAPLVVETRAVAR